jgi:phospholipase C
MVRSWSRSFGLVALVSAVGACGSSPDEAQTPGGGGSTGEAGNVGAGGMSSGSSGASVSAGGSAGSGSPMAGSSGAGGSGQASDDGGGGSQVSMPEGGGACPSPVPADSTATQRKACMFKAGDLVAATLGVTAADRQKIPLKHIIVVMKENRSFDHMLGQLSKHGQPDAEPLPANFSNLDKAGAAVANFHQTTTCVHNDPAHQWNDMHTQVGTTGMMDGFVISGANSTMTDGHFVMGWYDNTDLPFYYFLANTFAVADHHFASVRSGTWPNRDYLLYATSDGVKSTGSGFPMANTPTIMSALDTKGVTWGAYAPATPFEGSINWMANHAGVHNIAAFKAALTGGTLPSVAFLDGPSDEHPTQDVQVGEAWTRDIYQSVIASPLWPTTAMIWTYDEAGGFFDHVPPGNSCVARPQDSAYFELGQRVPTVVVSPYARQKYVSHVMQEHTSITRLIEAVFDLPALTARDANSDAMLDMFDFACPPNLKPADAPAAGKGGCN